MRELTEDELALAPDWATHYYAFDSGTIQYESADLYVRFFKKTGRFGVERCNKEYGISGVVIPRKPFDITKHEFVDLEIGQAEINGDGIQLNMVDNSRPAIIYKRDVIAIAKALGVTAEDLE